MDRIRILLLIIPILFLSCAGIPEDGTGFESGTGSNPEHISEQSESSVFTDESELEPPVISTPVHEEPALVPPGEQEKLPHPSSEILETPVEPPLEYELLMDRAVELTPAEFIPLYEKGRLKGIIHDLDKNGYEDFLLLAAGREEGVPGDIESLKDPGRLFYERKEFIDYTLLIFYQYPGELFLRYDIPLGRQLVFLDFFYRPVSLFRDFPYGVMVSFKTQGGTVDEWVILSGKGISRFRLEETLSIKPVLQDIDDDGLIDIVIHQQAAEEGFGYETFLTWYRWSGADFEEMKSTNIVRNLKLFFSEVSNLLIKGELESLIEYALFPEVLSKLREEGMTSEEILEAVFPHAEEESLHLTGGIIMEVIFPVIMESPFTLEKEDFFEFPFTLGIISDQGGAYYRAHLVMSQNPFGDHQFGFIPVDK